MTLADDLHDLGDIAGAYCISPRRCRGCTHDAWSIVHVSDTSVVYRCGRCGDLASLERRTIMRRARAIDAAEMAAR